MPSSQPFLFGEIVGLIAEAKPTHVLDIGPGYGKYGLACREYAGPQLRSLVAIETEPRYLTRFPWLEAIYDDVYIGDGKTPRLNQSEGGLVLMIDVLEHMTFEDGAEVLRKNRCPIIVCTPMEWFQNPEATEYPSERHRSLWTAPMIAEAAGRPLDRESPYAASIGGVLVRVGPVEP